MEENMEIKYMGKRTGLHLLIFESRCFQFHVFFLKSNGLLFYFVRRVNTLLLPLFITIISISGSCVCYPVVCLARTWALPGNTSYCPTEFPKLVKRSTPKVPAKTALSHNSVESCAYLAHIQIYIIFTLTFMTICPVPKVKGNTSFLPCVDSCSVANSH